MLSRDCRHRLGLTVVGACSAERKPYGARLQTVRPCWLVIFAFSIVPRKPRAASSKSRVSENGSAFSIAACCAITAGVASLDSLLEISVIGLTPPVLWLKPSKPISQPIAIVGALECAARATRIL